MFALLPKRRGLDADTVAGNVCLGDVSGTLIQNFNQGTPPAEPSLPWRDLPAEPDVFRLLSWRTRLVRRLIGRDTERAALLDWARQASNQPAVRLLTGPGGSGKSRLAAEVADGPAAERSLGSVSLPVLSYRSLLRFGQQLVPWVGGWEPVFARLKQRTDNPEKRQQLLLVSVKRLATFMNDSISNRDRLQSLFQGAGIH